MVCAVILEPLTFSQVFKQASTQQRLLPRPQQTPTSPHSCAVACHHNWVMRLKTQPTVASTMHQVKISVFVILHYKNCGDWISQFCISVSWHVSTLICCDISWVGCLKVLCACFPLQAPAMSGGKKELYQNTIRSEFFEQHDSFFTLNRHRQIGWICSPPQIRTFAWCMKPNILLNLVLACIFAVLSS